MVWFWNEGQLVCLYPEKWEKFRTYEDLHDADRRHLHQCLQADPGTARGRGQQEVRDTVYSTIHLYYRHNITYVITSLYQ